MINKLSTSNLLFLTLVSIEASLVILLSISLQAYIYPTLFAIILVYISIPAIELLEKKCQLPRVLAVGLIFIIQLFIILIILFKGLPFVVLEITSLLKTLPKKISYLMNNINGFADQLGFDLNLENSVIEQKVSKLFTNLSELDTNAIKKTFAIAQGTANQLISTISWIVNLILIPILFFFIGIHYDGILDSIEAYTPIKYRIHFSNLLQEINLIISSFLRGQLLLMLALSICYSIGFNIVGVPYATALGILTGTMSFIPFLGTMTGMTIALFSLYSIQSTLYSFVGLGAVYCITGTLESLVLIPYFIGNSLGMSTFTSLIVLIIATKELGGIGLLLGIPIGAVLKHMFLSFATVCRNHKII